MKVIDLLNKIANNEEVPKFVIYKCHYWRYDKERNDYFDEDNDFVFSCSDYDIINMLNDEIKIIEEKPKKIEKIECYESCRDEMILVNKINELTKAVNHLLEKESDK